MPLRRFLPAGFSRGFWILFWGQLFNAIGTSLVFPFLTVYLHDRLGASLTLVGAILFVQGLAQAAAIFFGGFLADRWGRRPTMLLSLVSGGLLTVVLGLAHAPWLIVTTVTLRAMAFPLFGPSAQSMIADLVPRERLLEAFSLNRVASNTGIVIGPVLGTFLAARSFTPLFAISGVVTATFALALALLLSEETSPRSARAMERLTLHAFVDLDPKLLRFGLTTVLTGIVYSQLYWVLPGYLVVDLHQSKDIFGYLASENALLVVLLQVPISRYAARLSGESAMALGVLFYGLGFGLMALWHPVLLFALSVVLITVGENLVNPAATTWAAVHAGTARRGRTIGLLSLANRLGSGLGPLVGGSALDAGGPWMLWGSVAAMAVLASVLYARLGRHRPKEEGLTALP